MSCARVVSVFVLLVLLASAGALAQGGPAGAVYGMTNAAEGNEVVAWSRDARGRLTRLGSFATGGRGSGGDLDPLGSQDALRLSDDRRWLFAVNAGSDDVSVFRVTASGLELADRFPSGGSFPVSVTQRGDRLYVLNIGGDGSLAGFILAPDGRSSPIPGSVLSLELGDGSPPNTGGAPSQVGFSPDGRWLLVVDKGRDLLLSFPLDDQGRPGEPVVNPSAGRLPFAFRFMGGFLVVVEIFGRSPSPSPAGTSAVSSYALGADGRLRTITAALPTGRTALCWIDAIGRYAWGTNTGDNTLTGFQVNRRGRVTLIGSRGVAFNLGNRRLPLEIAVSADGRFLYTLNAGTGTVGMFQILPNRRLKSLGEAPGLPVLRGVQGLAAW
ncbi:MAG TPA: beta-propeller fold lactonase family protein [Thermoanaerobaculia bacterium]|nr:beta-propeller fold lactonase family protein [Thermoanaerobaculia bacterium]